MTLFPSAAEMRGMLGPVVKDAVEQLGSIADIYALAPIKKRDNSVSTNPALAASDVRIKLDQISAEDVQEIFGLNPTIMMKGKMTRENFVEPGMVMEITAGDFAGRWLKIEKVIEKPLSDSYVLGLSDTGALT